MAPRAPTRQQPGPWLIASAFALLACGNAMASPVLIVRNDGVFADPPSTQAVANLSALHLAAGNTVTVLTALPASLSGYGQVWDLDFRSGLSASEQSSYLAYLQQGGRLVLIGENDSVFGTRNQTIRDFIASAGGGAVGAHPTTPAVNETLRAPFNSPEPTTTPFVLAAPAFFDNPGTGDWLLAAPDDEFGSGLAFDAGDLAHAPRGTLLSVLDVDFLGDLPSAFSPQWRAMSRNLVAGIDADPVGRVSEPSVLALLGMALTAAAWRSRRQPV